MLRQPKIWKELGLCHSSCSAMAHIIKNAFVSVVDGYPQILCEFEASSIITFKFYPSLSSRKINSHPLPLLNFIRLMQGLCQPDIT
jgi:hypothetical protein